MATLAATDTFFLSLCLSPGRQRLRREQGPAGSLAPWLLVPSPLSLGAHVCPVVEGNGALRTSPSPPALTDL